MEHNRFTSIRIAPRGYTQLRQYVIGVAAIFISLTLVGITSQPVQAVVATHLGGHFTILASAQEGSDPSHGYAQSDTQDAQEGTPKISDMQPSAELKDKYATLSKALLASLPQLSGSLEGWGAEFSTDSFTAFKSGISLDVSRFDSLNEFTSGFFRTGGGDGRVAAAASEYAAQLAALKAPELNFGSWELGTLEVPEEGVLFGLVFDQSLADIMSDTSLLDSVTSNELNSPEARETWKASMAGASEKVNQNLGDLLIGSCYGAFLVTLGGGKEAAAKYGFSDDCIPCVVSGLYLNSEMNRLLDPTFDSQYFDPADNVLTPAEFAQVPSWLKDPISAHDPQRARQLEGVRPRVLDTAHIRDCGASATAGTAAVGGVLDNFNFEGLGSATP